MTIKRRARQITTDYGKCGPIWEVMANTLEVIIADLGGLALNATKVVQIDNLCTVFAGS